MHSLESPVSLKSFTWLISDELGMHNLISLMCLINLKSPDSFSVVEMRQTQKRFLQLFNRQQRNCQINYLESVLKVRLLTMDFSKYMRDAMTVVKTVYALRWAR